MPTTLDINTEEETRFFFQCNNWHNKGIMRAYKKILKVNYIKNADALPK
jgi:hypothetical protein